MPAIRLIIFGKNPGDEKKDEMVLQMYGNWVSKNIIESLFVIKQEEKLMKVWTKTIIQIKKHYYLKVY